MKKNTWLKTMVILLIALVFSLLITNLIIPFININKGNSSSRNSCLTEKLTDEMTIEDIGNLYKDSCVAVNIKAELYGQKIVAQGSGVCVASKGYKTNLNYTVAKGSYIVTNYHVIEIVLDDKYSSIELSILTENLKQYSCDLLWFEKNTDVAVLYAENANLDYIKMKDRAIDALNADLLKIEEVFTISTPLAIENLNDFTKGDVRNSRLKSSVTAFYRYYYYDSVSQKLEYTLDINSIKDATSIYPMLMLKNSYLDIISTDIEISQGSSGGGMFDKQGFLIGLMTLSTSTNVTNGNSINGAVPIYPVVKVIDKVIVNNEISASETIYTISGYTSYIDGKRTFHEGLAVRGIDWKEAECCLEIYDINKKNNIPGFDVNNLYINGQFYDFMSYGADFEYIKEYKDGYYILDNVYNKSLLSFLKRGYVINGAKNGYETKVNFKDRNDFLFFLLNVDKGDNVEISYFDDNGLQKTQNVIF